MVRSRFLWRMPMSAAVAGVLVLAAAATAAESWPQFRGPTAQGHAPDMARGLPVSWGPQQNIVWKTPLPGEGWSSPVLSDGRIFVTAAVAQPEQETVSLRVLAIEAATGEVVWNQEVFQPSLAVANKIHSKNSKASPTAIVANDRVYVHFGHMGTACLTSAGEVVWKNNDFRYEPVHGNGGSPALAGGKLIFSIDGRQERKVVALDAATGKLAWSTPRPGDPVKHFSFSTPLVIEVNGRQQVISPGSDVVNALDVETGEPIWHAHYTGYSVIPRPVSGHGLVFLSTSYDSAKALAIDPTGTGDVTDTHIKWTLSRGAPHTPSMLLVEDCLYMVSDRGVASCVDPKTGDIHWQERLGGNYSASPVYADGRIYFQSEQGETTVIKPGKTYEEVATSDLGERTLASYAIGNGAIFLRSVEGLYRIEKKE